MKKIVILALVILAACGTDSYYDPTGTWSTTLTWGAGDCGLENQSSTARFVIDELASGDYLIRDTSNSNATASGTVVRTHDDATVDIQSVDPDLFRDGGSTTGTLLVKATADGDMSIVGTGSIHLTGFFVCSQACVVTGTLLP